LHDTDGLCISGEVCSRQQLAANYLFLCITYLQLSWHLTRIASIFQ